MLIIILFTKHRRRCALPRHAHPVAPAWACSEHNIILPPRPDPVPRAAAQSSAASLRVAPHPSSSTTSTAETAERYPGIRQGSSRLRSPARTAARLPSYWGPPLVAYPCLALRGLLRWPDPPPPCRSASRLPHWPDPLPPTASAPLTFLFLAVPAPRSPRPCRRRRRRRRGRRRARAH